MSYFIGWCHHFIELNDKAKLFYITERISVDNRRLNFRGHKSEDFPIAINKIRQNTLTDLFDKDWATDLSHRIIRYRMSWNNLSLLLY